MSEPKRVKCSLCHGRGWHWAQGAVVYCAPCEATGKLTEAKAAQDLLTEADVEQPDPLAAQMAYQAGKAAAHRLQMRELLSPTKTDPKAKP